MITAVLVALGRGVEVTAHWMACIAAALLFCAAVLIAVPAFSLFVFACVLKTWSERHV